MSTLRFLTALVSTNLKAAVSLRGSFLLQAALMALNNLLYFTVWWVLFGRFERICGWDIGDMQVLYGCVASSFGMTVVLGGGVLGLARTVLDGQLDVYLTQPKDALLHAVASRSWAAGFGDLASGLGLLWLSGKVPLSSVPAALLAVACGAVVSLSCAVIFHSAVFWVGDVSALTGKLWEFLVTFSLHPDPLFSGALRLFLFTLLPAGFVGYLPAELVRSPSWRAFAFSIAGALGFALLARWVFRRGLRRYESGNQFGVRA